MKKSLTVLLLLAWILEMHGPQPAFAQEVAADSAKSGSIEMTIHADVETSTRTELNKDKLRYLSELVLAVKKPSGPYDLFQLQVVRPGNSPEHVQLTLFKYRDYKLNLYSHKQQNEPSVTAQGKRSTETKDLGAELQIAPMRRVSLDLGAFERVKASDILGTRNGTGDFYPTSTKSDDKSRTFQGGASANLGKGLTARMEGKQTEFNGTENQTIAQGGLQGENTNDQSAIIDYASRKPIHSKTIEHKELLQWQNQEAFVHVSYSASDTDGHASLADSTFETNRSGVPKKTNTEDKSSFSEKASAMEVLGQYHVKGPFSVSIQFRNTKATRKGSTAGKETVFTLGYESVTTSEVTNESTTEASHGDLAFQFDNLGPWSFEVGGGLLSRNLDRTSRTDGVAATSQLDQTGQYLRGRATYAKRPWKVYAWGELGKLDKPFTATSGTDRNKIGIGVSNKSKSGAFVDGKVSHEQAENHSLSTDSISYSGRQTRYSLSGGFTSPQNPQKSVSAKIMFVDFDSRTVVEAEEQDLASGPGGAKGIDFRRFDRMAELNASWPIQKDVIADFRAAHLRGGSSPFSSTTVGGQLTFNVNGIIVRAKGEHYFMPGKDDQRFGIGLSIYP